MVPVVRDDRALRLQRGRGRVVVGKMGARTVTEDQLRLDLVARKGSMDLEQYRDQIKRVTKVEVSASHLSNMMRGERTLSDVVLKYLGWERVTVTTFRKVGK